MTGQSSCKKSFFKEYFFYRLKELRGQFLVCCILNLLSLPFVGAALLFFSDNQYHIIVENQEIRDARAVIDSAVFISILCWGVLLILACLGAAFSFVYCNKKEFTDTLGVLPLTHRERFWGDFLGGYTATVLPIVPSALISMILFSLAQGSLNKLILAEGAKPCGNAVNYAIGLCLSLFFAYTFAYIFGTLAAVCCGKIVHTIVFSFLSLAVFPLLAVSVLNCVLKLITGFDGTEVLYDFSAFLPPLGLITGEITDILKGSLIAVSSMTAEKMSQLFNCDFTLMKPYAVIIYCVGAAALTALAYYIAKTRRQERVGSSFVNTAVFHALSLSTVVLIVMFILAEGGRISLLLSVLLAFAASAVVMLVFEIIRLPRAKEIPKTLLRFAAAFVCCLGLYILLDKTGSFGLRYTHPDIDDIDHLNVSFCIFNNDGFESKDEKYKITDRKDIEQLIDSHNNTLRSSYMHVMNGKGYSNRFSVEYVLKDGTTELRSFSDIDPYSGYSGIDDMIGNVYALDGYLEMRSAVLTGGTELHSCAVTMKNTFEQYVIAEDKISEFAKILAAELVEKGTVDSEECGRAEFVISEMEGKYENTSFVICENYTKTLDYLKTNVGFDNTADENEPVIYLSYHYYKDYDSDEESGFDLNMSVNIYRRDLDTELVKELLTLIKARDSVKIEAEDINFSIIIQTSPYLYYIPKSAHKRVLEIMTELCLNDI